MNISMETTRSSRKHPFSLHWSFTWTLSTCSCICCATWARTTAAEKRQEKSLTAKCSQAFYKIKSSQKGTSQIFSAIEMPSGSAVAGNGNLSGEDQLVDINGHSKEDLHRYHLLNFLVVYYSKLYSTCKGVFVKNINLHHFHIFDVLEHG